MAWNCDVSIEEKVRQDCYNRGYEQGRKNPCEEIVAHIEKLQKQVKEYQDKIEQGTLIELPCKVGDTVWEVSPFSKFPTAITAPNIHTILRWKEDEVFGCELFLTREEAEKRLEELQNG